MKRAVLLIMIHAMVLAGPSFIGSQAREILCCRPVCVGCGPGRDALCDYKTAEECGNLKGWEVEDCTDCDTGKD